jgi:hypothetical protein
MVKPIPKKIGKVQVEQLGKNLIKLIAPPSFNFLIDGSTPNCLWLALVEIQKMRRVTCVYRRDESWRRECLIVATM